MDAASRLLVGAVMYGLVMLAFAWAIARPLRLGVQKARSNVIVTLNPTRASS